MIKNHIFSSQIAQKKKKIPDILCVHLFLVAKIIRRVLFLIDKTFFFIVARIDSLVSNCRATITI